MASGCVREESGSRVVERLGEEADQKGDAVPSLSSGGFQERGQDAVALRAGLGPGSEGDLPHDDKESHGSEA